MSTPTTSPSQTAAQRVSRNTFIVSALTMLSRVLGLVRDKCLVLLFGGTTPILDAFVFAFTIPNLFRRLFGEGALTAAFIPVFVRSYHNDGREDASRLSSNILSLLAAVTGGIAILGIVLCMVLKLVLPDSGELHLMLNLTAVMLPFLCLICCAALLAGILQCLQIFSVPAAMSIILNLAFICTFAYLTYSRSDLAPESAIYYVAFAVVLAGLLQVLIQAPLVRMRGIALAPSLARNHPGVNDVLRALGPTAVGLGIVQINVLLDNTIAYWMSLHGAPGANTYLYLANRLMQLPLGVFGIAIATTVFPSLSRYAAEKDLPSLLKQLHRSIRLCMFIILPAAVGLAVLADPIIRLIYQEPDLTFTDDAVYRTALTLGCYTAGLVFFSLQHLFTRVFYAMQDYKTPVRLSVWMVGVNLVLNLTLIHAPDLYLRWAEHETAVLNEAGLALATSLTAILNISILWIYLKRKLQATMPQKSINSILDDLPGSLFWIVVAAFGMGAGVFFIRNSIPYEPELLMRAQKALVPVVLGVLCYIILCLVIPLPEYDEFIRRRKPTEKDDEDAADKA